MALNKSIFGFLEKLGYSPKDLSFRFPIETLDSLLKRFYKEYDQSAFLIQANNRIADLSLRKITKSYVLKVPVLSQSNESLYIGVSDVLTFLILFDEPNYEEHNISEQKSRFFLTFDPSIINSVFSYFYKNHCRALSTRDKKLLIQLKNIKNNELNPFYISKFQEALLINALNENNKVKQEKIVEAISFTDEAVVITDLAGNIKEVNRNFEKTFANLGNTIKDILPEEAVKSAISQTTKESNWQSEINLKLSVGKSELMQVSSFLFKDELGRPNGFVFTFKNITELKKLDYLNKQLINKLRENNVQLSEVNKRLVEADRIKSDLLSVVSHELKTPVSTILGFSELITSRNVEGDAVRQYAEQITDSAKKLDRLITDYLDVACNQFGISSNKLITMPINLSDLIRVCYEEQKRNLHGINFEFEMNCLGYEPVIITEAQNMQKLFSNLLNNSLKYSPDGGKISIKILNDSETVTISVADQGIGMTTEQAMQVFEPFYRVDNSITREFAGIGLGLAVCKKIVEIYNGAIWCEPGLDLGTVFYVTLPVNPNKPKVERKPQRTSLEKETIESEK